MSYEIEMLSLGDADSFIIKYIDDLDREFIVLIDAGKVTQGPLILGHMRKYYNINKIDLAISTHLDRDHIGGFEYIVKNIEISEFWIHDPREHFGEATITKIIKNASKLSGLEPLTESIRQSKSLNELLDTYTEIIKKEPVPDMVHGSIPLYILGPSIEYYKKQLNKFKDLENLHEGVNKNSSITKLTNSILNSEEIDRDNKTPASNNSSTIILFYVNEREHVFTGDAGVEALEEAFSHFERTHGKRLKNIFWLGVPHHGSIKNLTTKLIYELSPDVSFISAKGDNLHPSKNIIDALENKGSLIYCTSHSGNIFLSFEKSEKEGFLLANPISNYNEDDYYQNYLLTSIFRRV